MAAENPDVSQNGGVLESIPILHKFPQIIHPESFFAHYIKILGPIHQPMLRLLLAPLYPVRAFASHIFSTCTRSILGSGPICTLGDQYLARPGICHSVISCPKGELMND